MNGILPIVGASIIYAIGFLFTFSAIRVANGGQNTRLLYDDAVVGYLFGAAWWPIVLPVWGIIKLTGMAIEWMTDIIDGWSR